MPPGWREWRSSSHSGTNGGQCVEVGVPSVRWRKSSLSGTNGGQCVEVGSTPGRLALRDSKDPDGGMLALSRDGFRDVLAAVKAR